MENLIKQITELEIKASIYSERLGPNSEEVKQIDKKIAELNTILLDYMVENP
jgi:ribosomal protein L29